MLAVLEDALGIYRKYAGVPGRRRRRLITETEQWLFSDDTGWPFSFVNVCHALGIDVALFRAQRRRPTPATAAFEALPLIAVAS